MRGRFRDLWKRVAAKGNADEVFDFLVQKYSEPHRKYHTLEHIQACLELLDEVKELVDDFDALEWAIWFHDVIYEIPGPENEIKSAQLAMEFAKRAGLRERFVLRVGRLILITKGHKTTLRNNEYDECLISDIDLAILGKSSEVFDLFEENVWLEYGSVYTREQFCRGRSNALEEFAKRKPIFQIARLQKQFEDQAHTNLLAAIARLKRELIP